MWPTDTRQAHTHTRGAIGCCYHYLSLRCGVIIIHFINIQKPTVWSVQQGTPPCAEKHTLALSAFSLPGIPTWLDSQQNTILKEWVKTLWYFNRICKVMGWSSFFLPMELRLDRVSKSRYNYFIVMRRLSRLRRLRSKSQFLGKSNGIDIAIFGSKCTTNSINARKQRSTIMSHIYACQQS